MFIAMEPPEHTEDPAVMPGIDSDAVIRNREHPLGQFRLS